jgi:hypothetical protein
MEKWKDLVCFNIKMEINTKENSKIIKDKEMEY